MGLQFWPHLRGQQSDSPACEGWAVKKPRRYAAERSHSPGAGMRQGENQAQLLIDALWGGAVGMGQGGNFCRWRASKG